MKQEDMFYKTELEVKMAEKIVSLKSTIKEQKLLLDGLARLANLYVRKWESEPECNAHNELLNISHYLKAGDFENVERECIRVRDKLAGKGV